MKEEKKTIIPYQSDDCAIGYAFRAIEGKWKLPVMYVLGMNGTLRYNDLKRAVGCTNMMLTNTLTELAEFGLVDRKQYYEIPPRVEYSMTENGRKLIPVLEAFGGWGELLLKGQNPKDKNNHG